MIASTILGQSIWEPRGERRGPGRQLSGSVDAGDDRIIAEFEASLTWHDGHVCGTLAVANEADLQVE